MERKRIVLDCEGGKCNCQHCTRDIVSTITMSTGQNVTSLTRRRAIEDERKK